MVRVLIVAAYASVRAGLHALLVEAEGLDVLGAVGGSEELASVMAEARPDVVLFDAVEGEDERVLALLSGSETALVVLAEQGEGFPMLTGAALPGWAYLLKDAEGGEIAAAVRAAAAGLAALDRSLLSSAIAAPLLRTAPWADGGLPHEALTAREREVLQLMAEGLANRQIAARLHISPHTVKFHVASVLAKLGAASRTEAVTLGARRGYVLL
jgi:two-component system, NarL family, response regulator YdfI